MPMPIAAAATAVVKESLNHCCAAIPITAGSRHRRISLLQKKKCCASSWYDDSCIPGGTCGTLAGGLEEPCASFPDYLVFFIALTILDVLGTEELV